MRLSKKEIERRWKDHQCVSAMGRGYNKARDLETVCGHCGSWFYWDKGYCNERNTRRKFT